MHFIDEETEVKSLLKLTQLGLDSWLLWFQSPNLFTMILYCLLIIMIWGRLQISKKKRESSHPAVAGNGGRTWKIWWKRWHLKYILKIGWDFSSWSWRRQWRVILCAGRSMWCVLSTFNLSRVVVTPAPLQKRPVWLKAWPTDLCWSKNAAIDSGVYKYF